MLPALEGASPLSLFYGVMNPAPERLSHLLKVTQEGTVFLCVSNNGELRMLSKGSLDFISQLREDFESGNSTVSSGRMGLRGVSGLQAATSFGGF